VVEENLLEGCNLSLDTVSHFLMVQELQQQQLGVAA
jgi:hypothetical protein